MNPAAALTVGAGTIGSFEQDGNLVVDADPLDWANVTPTVSFDDTADSGFTQGSKELQPSAWVCGTGGANPDKGNLLRAYVSTRLSAAEAFVDLAWVREGISGQGDVHVNFEFNQRASSNGAFAPGPCPLTRLDGDLLVTYDFPGGGAEPEIRLWKWDSSAGSGGDEGSWIEVAIPAGGAKAAVNQAPVADPIAGGTVDTQRFGEATIDLAAALPPDAISGCFTFGELNVRSRSSGESLTSALQDKLPGTAIDLSTCGRVVVHKTDDAGRPLTGATFGLFAGGAATGTPVATCTSLADGSCSFRDVEPGTYSVKELSAPAGYGTDPTAATVEVRFRETVDVARPFVDPRDTGYVRVDKRLRDAQGREVVPADPAVLDGAAFVAYVDADGDGALDPAEEATLWPSGAPASCTISGGAGSCLIGPLVPGPYRIHETVAPFGTDPGPDVTVTVVKSGTDDPAVVAFTNLVPPLDLALDKTGPDVAHVGDEVTYTFTASTNGPRLHDVTLEELAPDRCDGAPAGPSKSGGDADAFLEPGERWTWTCSHVVTASDPDPLPNAARVTGTDDFGRQVTATDDHAIDVLHPAVRVVKDGPAQAHEGDTVTYSFAVTNTGDATLAPVVVADDVLGAVGIIASLAPGQTQTLTKTFLVPAGAADVVNTATACGTDAAGRTVCDDDDHRLDRLHPAVAIDKKLAGADHSTPADAYLAHVGDDVAYTVVVTNTGDTPLRIVTLTDTNTVAMGCDAGPGDTLAIGQRVSCAYTLHVGQDDVHNTAAVSGVDALGRTVLASDDTFLRVVKPGIRIVKSGPARAHEGDTVTYAFAVTNTGNMTLAPVVVTDDVLGAVGIIASLAPGQTQTLTKTFTVPAGDADVVNTATACGTDPAGGQVCDDDDHRLDRLHPAVAIDKKVEGGDHASAADAHLAHEGDTLHYTVVATNTGDTPLRIAALDDTNTGAMGCDTAVGDTLDPGERASCAYTLTAGGDDVHNVASIAGTDALGGRATASDQTFVDVLNPGIELDKSGPATAHEGDTVTYTFAVTNTGADPLADVTVTDDVLGEIGTLDALDVGQTRTLSKTFLVPAGTADVLNTATACATDDGGKTVCDTDVHSLDRLHPAISLDKTVAEGDHATDDDALLVHGGDALAYRVVITNTGDTPLTVTALTDSLVSSMACDAGVGSTLAVGGRIACAYPRTAGDDLERNTATVIAVDAIGGPKGTVTATDRTVVRPLHPAVTIDKTANPTSVTGSGLVTFTYVVRNAGDTALAPVRVTDDVLGDVGTIARLEPGASATLTKDGLVALPGPTRNVGTATGTDPLGRQVTDSDDATVSVVLAAVIAPASLPTTGAHVARMASLAMFLVAAGAAVLGRRRRGEFLG